MGRIRLEREDLQKLSSSPMNNNVGVNIKEVSFRIMTLVFCLVVFVAGMVVGLVSSSHVDKYMSSRPELLFYMNHVASVDGSVPIASVPTNNCTIIRSCPKVDCLSLENFAHPKALIHKLSDNELFWRASIVPKIDKYPFNRVPKVAFMFLTRGPLPFLPLWERFFGGHDGLFSIYVHTSPGFILNISPDSVFYGRQIPSEEVSWGSISLAAAEKRLLANALLDFSNERFVLLSESCIPVYNFKTVYKYLTQSAHSFVESYDDPSRYGRGRYSRWMAPSIRIHQWRKGSQWFELNRGLAIEIISDFKYYDLFRKYCHPSCYPDEHYIPTYLNIFHPSLNSNRTVTWVDWSFGGPHPATFGGENVTASFIRNIRNNGTDCLYNSQRTSICYLFARKFSPDALDALLNISSKVMGF